MSEGKNGAAAQREGDEQPRRPYQKPALTWDDDLGMRPGLIAACNKVEPLGPCDTGSLQS